VCGRRGRAELYLAQDERRLANEAIGASNTDRPAGASCYLKFDPDSRWARELYLFGACSLLGDHILQSVHERLGPERGHRLFGQIVEADPVAAG
jgi:hypothetical protein